MSKSKRIRDAARELRRALNKHVDVVTDSAVPLKKAQRAAARVASAAAVYAEAVQAKTGLGNPFLEGGGRLDDQAQRSLRAERDKIYEAVTGSMAAVEELPAEVDLSSAAGDEEREEGRNEGSPAVPAFAPVPPVVPAAPVPPLSTFPPPLPPVPPLPTTLRTVADEPGWPPQAAPEQPPALPEQEPRSEEEKPYSEDI